MILDDGPSLLDFQTFVEEFEGVPPWNRGRPQQVGPVPPRRTRRGQHARKRGDRRDHERLFRAEHVVNFAKGGKRPFASAAGRQQQWGTTRKRTLVKSDGVTTSVGNQAPLAMALVHQAEAFLGLLIHLDLGRKRAAETGPEGKRSPRLDLTGRLSQKTPRDHPVRNSIAK